MTREQIHSREAIIRILDAHDKQLLTDFEVDPDLLKHDPEHGQCLAATTDAILDAMPAPVWQPIETAPKDGTRFLAFEQSGDYCVSECWWQRDFSEWEGWQNDWDSEPNPTHWMPLPAPPTTHPEQPEPIREAARLLLAEITPHISKRAEQASEAAQGMHHHGDAGNANDIVEAFLRALEGGA